MEKNRLNLLFVLPNASRTGAPIVALHFFKWLKKVDCCDFSIIVKADGPLMEAYSAVAPAFVWNPQLPYSSIVKRAVLKALRGVKVAYKRPLPKALAEKKFDLIYGHTVVTTDVFDFLHAHYKCKIICHVHENGFSTKNYFPAFLEASKLKLIDHFIAVSDTTIDNLVYNYGIERSHISKCYEFIDTKELVTITKTPSSIREELNIQPGDFVVGACGVTTWRKGVDLFAYLVSYIDRKIPGNNIQFIWLGTIDDGFICYYEYEIAMLGLEKRILFTGAKPDPNNYFQIFDVFALTSREDPFPLVCLEAASLGVPVLCFDNAGGIPEVINNGLGHSFPYGAIDVMGEKIIGMYTTRNSTLTNAGNSSDIVKAFDVAVAGRQIIEIIEAIV